MVIYFTPLVIYFKKIHLIALFLKYSLQHDVLDAKSIKYKQNRAWHFKEKY